MVVLWRIVTGKLLTKNLGMSSLRVRHESVLALVEHSDVDEGRAVAAAPVAEEDLGRADGAVVEVGGEAAGRGVDELEAVGHILAQGGEYHLTKRHNVAVALKLFLQSLVC